MDLKEQKILESNRDTTLLLIPVVAVLAKFIYFYILPDKYFFDSWRMVSMLVGDGKMQAWDAYETTVNFYRSINFLNLTTINQWSIVLGIIMTIMLMFIISRTYRMTIMQCLFVLMATGLLNIYVFNITKETVQLLFFVLIYIIICLPINNQYVKMILCALVFYWESTFYRTYYIIMAAMTVFLFLVFKWLRSREDIKKKHVALTIIMCFIAVFIFLYVSQFVSHDDYISALNIRDKSTITDATSIIKNPIEVNGNLGIFMFDYVINAIRMMIPIELIVKSPVYAPFVIFQIFILYYYIRVMINIKKININMVLVLSCFSAYLFGSFIFEPDFGSWVRHESATFPIMQMMVLQSENYNSEFIGME